MGGDAVLTDKPQAGVRMITLNRPEVLNAINGELIEGFHDALDEVAADNGCRVLLLTGTGRGFCAGADLKGGWTDAPAADRAPPSDITYGDQRRLSSLISRLRAITPPVVAAVNGPAAGGGLAFALAADVRVAATTARFLVANVKIGLSGGEMGISYLLPRVVGGGRAAELMLTGRTVDADEALAIGLVTQVVEPAKILAAALDVADRIQANSAFGVALTKEVLALGADAPSLDHAINVEAHVQVMATYSGAMADAVAAFRETHR